jgi:hypothetical protein
LDSILAIAIQIGNHTLRASVQLKRTINIPKPASLSLPAGAEPPSSQKSNIKVPLIVGLSVAVFVFAITILIYRLRIRSSDNPGANKEEEMEPPTPAFRDKVVSKDNVSGTQLSYGDERKLHGPLWISPGKSTELRGPQYGAGSSLFVYDEGPRAPQCPKGS